MNYRNFLCRKLLVGGDNINKIQVIFLAVVILTGCAEPMTYRTLGKVGMLGVDYLDGQYIASVQVLNNSFNNDLEENFDCYQGKGRTISGALESMELKTGTKLFWDSVKVIAIGGDAAVKGTKQILQSLNNKGNLHPNTLITIVSPSANVLVMGKDKESGVGSSKIESWLLEGVKNRKIPESSILTFLKTTQQKGTGGLASFINVDQLGEDPKEIGIEGSAIMYQDAMVAVLDKELTSTVLWLGTNPEILSMEIVSDKMDAIGGIIKKSKVNLKPMVADGKLVFLVEMNLDSGVFNNVADQKAMG